MGDSRRGGETKSRFQFSLLEKGHFGKYFAGGKQDLQTTEKQAHKLNLLVTDTESPNACRKDFWVRATKLSHKGQVALLFGIQAKRGRLRLPGAKPLVK